MPSRTARAFPPFDLGRLPVQADPGPSPEILGSALAPPLKPEGSSLYDYFGRRHTATVRVDAHGRISLPSPTRRFLSVDSGSTVIVDAYEERDPLTGTLKRYVVLSAASDEPPKNSAE